MIETRASKQLWENMVLTFSIHHFPKCAVNGDISFMQELGFALFPIVMIDLSCAVCGAPADFYASSEPE